MLKMLPILVAIVAIGAGLLLTYKLYEVPDMPELDLNKWWGVGPKTLNEDTSIRPFKIKFDNKTVQDLKERLRNRRPFTKPLEGIQSQYGMNTDYLEKILDYWVEKYDFGKREDLLNQFPHYKTKIQGLDIHFIRVKPQVKEGVTVLPLLMLHGWPSSSKEFVKVLPLLTTPKNGYDFVFEVIAPDLPGYGFSEGTNKPGLSPLEIGIIMRNLMMRIGFNKFYIQAGDWGSQVATHLSTIFQDQVLGFHTNMPLSSRPISNIKLLLGSLVPSLTPHSERIYPLKKFMKYLLRESGYYHMQATKPDTIGVALTDSPAGLASYIMEKIAICSNRDQLDTPHGGLENLDLDDVLDTVTIIWVNNCVVTSMRLYSEGYSGKLLNLVHSIPTKVPTAAIKFLYEVMYHSDWILKDKFPNLVRSTTFEFGGHFAALHTPQVLVDDVFAAAKDFINFHKNNKIQG